MRIKPTIALVALLLVGCGSTPPTPPAEVLSEKIIYEPPLPKPLRFCDVTWKVLIVDNQPYVALSYEDNINFAVCAKDLEKYISEVNLVVCHYRQCIKEEN